jgi:hypothetical protein
MASVQVTYREILRYIYACLRAQPAKLYQMGFRKPIILPTFTNFSE